jgi:hypothetical protein
MPYSLQGNSRAVMTKAVGKGCRDDKGFREAVTALAAGAGCRDRGGTSTTFFARRQGVGEEERPLERIGAVIGATGHDLYVICKIRLDPFPI